MLFLFIMLISLRSNFSFFHGLFSTLTTLIHTFIFCINIHHSSSSLSPSSLFHHILPKNNLCPSMSLLHILLHILSSMFFSPLHVHQHLPPPPPPRCVCVGRVRRVRARARAGRAALRLCTRSARSLSWGDDGGGWMDGWMDEWMRARVTNTV